MVRIDDDEVEINLIPSRSASIAFFQRKGGEQATIWDSPETARVMEAVLRAESGSLTVCLQAGVPYGMGVAPIGYAIALLPQVLPPTVTGVLGRSQFERPRAILVVDPIRRQEGIGRALMNDLLRRLADDGHRVVEAESEMSCLPFFERLGFRVVQGAVRDYQGRTMFLLRRDL